MTRNFLNQPLITSGEVTMIWSSPQWIFLLVFQILAQRYTVGTTASRKARQFSGFNQISLNNSALKPWLNSTINFQADTKVGILIEKDMYSHYRNALLFHNSSLHGITLIPKVVENNPYDVLQAICNNNFTEKGVSGIVFICDEPCSEMASFATLLGWSGIVVKRHSTERSPIFPVSFYLAIFYHLFLLSIIYY